MEAILIIAAVMGSCAVALGASRIALAALFAALTGASASPRRARREKIAVAVGEAKLLAR